jgi:hypothetical protein
MYIPSCSQYSSTDCNRACERSTQARVSMYPQLGGVSEVQVTTCRHGAIKPPLQDCDARVLQTNFPDLAERLNHDPLPWAGAQRLPWG